MILVFRHSAIYLSTYQHCQWDSSKSGFIIIAKEDLENEGIDLLDLEDFQRLDKIVQGELNTYNQWLNGDIIGYVVKNEDEHLDSLWGIYVYDTKEETEEYVRSSVPEEYAQCPIVWD